MLVSTRAALTSVFCGSKLTVRCIANLCCGTGAKLTTGAPAQIWHIKGASVRCLFSLAAEDSL